MLNVLEWISSTMSGKIQQYDRFKIISIQEAFDLIRSGNPTSHLDGELVTSAPSLRLQTFMTKGLECVYDGCGLVGAYFAVERSPRKGGPGVGPFHMNLWAVDSAGKEVLFTHDHIIARSFGGPDTLDNSQTMCCWHNAQKAKEESRLSNWLHKKQQTRYTTFELLLKGTLPRYLTRHIKHSMSSG